MNAAGGIIRREDDFSIFMNENAGAQGPHHKETVGLRDLPVNIVYQNASSTFPGVDKAKIEDALKNHINQPGAFMPTWKYFKLDKITVTSSKIQSTLNPKKYVEARYTWVEVEAAPQGKWRVKGGGQSITTSEKEAVTVLGV